MHVHVRACTHTHTHTCMNTITIEGECIGKVREMYVQMHYIISSHLNPPYFDTAECILDARHHIMRVIIQRQVSSGLEVHL